MTGPGVKYTAAEEAELSDFLDQAFTDAGRLDLTNATLDVTAVIEWNGTVARTTKLGPEGMRRIANLPGLDLTGVQTAGRSYGAKGWHAQLAQLTDTAAGRSAADVAGLAPSRTTLLRWLGGTQSPNRQNQEAISRAYENTRGQVTDHQRARALTNAIDKADYGILRFRNIRDLNIK